MSTQRDKQIEAAAGQIARDCGLTVCTDLFNAVETGAQLGAKWADANPRLDHPLVLSLVNAAQELNSQLMRTYGTVEEIKKIRGPFLGPYVLTIEALEKYRAAVSALGGGDASISRK